MTRLQRTPKHIALADFLIQIEQSESNSPIHVPELFFYIVVNQTVLYITQIISIFLK